MYILSVAVNCEILFAANGREGLNVFPVNIINIRGQAAQGGGYATKQR